MYDVVIIGAGPAGSTCARACALAGLSTLLIDKEMFPRIKPCGGALSRQALSLLDFPLPQEIIEKECFGARLRFGSAATEIKKKDMIAALVSRETFDAFLADKAVEAGATFRQGERVESVTTRGERAAVRTAGGLYEARYLVGADGASSIAGRAIRPQMPREEMMAALVSRVPADDRQIEERLGGRLEMHFGIAPMGYGWVFPHKGYFSVGIMGLAAHLHDAQQRFTDFCASVGIAAGQPRGHTIPLGGIRRPVAGGRILLVGDAAGFGDPFHGEGMAYAIRSGKLAANAIAAAIKRNDAGALGRYERECDLLITRNLRVALMIARGLEKHPKLFLATFFAHSTALDKYLDIAAGHSDYSRFRRWFLMRLPWYLLRSFFQTT